MKKIKRLLLNGAAYTLLILALYYLFAAFSAQDVSVSSSRFLWIVLFGYIISSAGFIFDITQLNRAIRALINYAILLFTFCFVFIFGMSYKVNSPGTVFALIIIFTVLYVFFAILIHFSKKFVGFIDSKLDQKSTDTPDGKKNKKDSDYTYRFR